MQTTLHACICDTHRLGDQSSGRQFIRAAIKNTSHATMTGCAMMHHGRERIHTRLTHAAIGQTRMAVSDVTQTLPNVRQGPAVAYELLDRERKILLRQNANR